MTDLFRVVKCFFGFGFKHMDLGSLTSIISKINEYSGYYNHVEKYCIFLLIFFAVPDPILPILLSLPFHTELKKNGFRDMSPYFPVFPPRISVNANFLFRLLSLSIKILSSESNGSRISLFTEMI